MPVVDVVADLVKRGMMPLSIEVDRGRRWDRTESEAVSPLVLVVELLLDLFSNETSLEVKSCASMRWLL